MTREQPGGQDFDPNQTIRRRFPHPVPPPATPPPPAPRPSQPPQPSPAEPLRTQRLPYTPDMLPDVPHYEAKPPKSAWWWVILAGGLVLLIAAVAVAALLWIRDNADTAPRALPAPNVIRLG
ncbi:hypothetical protein ABZ897_47905 [Nonomuraea sp. NPDC046802]|uniref:hypothetical protein n=1 Tax=Nonomuraea sp. NPDC046802 TaxID=3154919 RepID=UPI0033E832FD